MKSLMIKKEQWMKISFVVITLWFIWFANTHFDEYTVRILNNIAIFVILAVS